MTCNRKVWALCLLVLASACAFGQSTTGTLLGTVTDPGGAAVPGVTVEAKNAATGATVTTTTGAEGIFVFNSLLPATYNITIRPTAGFKAYSQNGISVTTAEERDLGKITLSLGALTEQISVTADATPVQTASSENSKLVDSDQIQDLTLQGRDLFGFLRMIPGTIDSQESTTNENALGAIKINGGASDSTNFTVDGIADMDTGSNGTLHFEPTLDTIAEMRVLTANYQAEYGRNSNGSISVITKGGSQQFHGSAYADKRHEMFNANTFFNNYNGIPKAQYRFFVYGYSIGGPVYIPKVFNTQKKKLFFFFSQEYTKQKPGVQSGFINEPTVAQRAGNFAGYSDGNGNPYSLTDPSTGAPVPNNNISGLVLDSAAAKYGQAMLNSFPLPNICGNSGVASGGCFASPTFASTEYSQNYYWTFNEVHPRRNDTARVDWNLTNKLTSWVRYTNDYDQDTTGSSPGGFNSPTGTFIPLVIVHPNPGHGYAVGITYTITPTMVNEFTFGKSYNTWDYYPQSDDTLSRANMGNPPSFDNFATDPRYTNDMNSPRPTLSNGSAFYETGIPGVSFGGGQEPGETSYGAPCSGQCPYTNWNNIYSFNDDLSKVWGKHNLKAGVYIEHTEKIEEDQLGENQLGAYSFASSSTFSNTASDGFANAYLGNFNNYNEGQRVVGDYWYWDDEFFVQDNWRVSKRLTLDLGMRFLHQVPTIDTDHLTTDFVPSTYNPAVAERIYLPYCSVSTAAKACPTADNFAMDPGTGTKTFAALQGTLVPASVGGYAAGITPNPFSGMQYDFTSNLPGTLWTVSPLEVMPRIGFAWDVFGNGKTAIRGGFGEFYNQVSTQKAQNAAGQPPIDLNRTIYFSTIDQIPSFANSAAISPTSVTSTIGHQPIQGAYNGSLMLQQKLGFATVLEASYVFNTGVHLSETYKQNIPAQYGDYNPANYNPNEGFLAPGVTGKNLSESYYVPIPDYSTGMNYVNFSGHSNYRSLQITLRRNMTRHLSYGLAYTLNKTMSASPDPYFTDKFRNWGPSYTGAPQVLAVNYVYEVPNLGQRMNSKLLGVVTDHWSISGVTQWRSDIVTSVPGLSFSGTTSTNPQNDWLGNTLDSARYFVVGNWALPSGQTMGPQPTALVQAVGANANGTPGNALINAAAFVIPYPCSLTPGATPQKGIGESSECLGNAGSGSLITLPGTHVNNWDMTFGKSFPLKSETRVLQFRAQVYNIFNHPQFSAASISPSYNWPNWQNGLLEQASSSLGRYSSTLAQRQMSMELRFQF